MEKKLARLSIVLTIIFGSFLWYAASTSAQTSSPSDQDLKNQIQDLENKIQNLQGQERTLSSQIDYMDDQITISTLKINMTKKQVKDLEDNITATSGKINTLEGSLDNLSNVLLARIAATYRSGTSQPLQLLLSAKSFTDFITKSAYLKLVQNHDRKLMMQVQMTKVSYSEQKQVMEDKQAKLKDLQTSLLSYTKELGDEEKSKKILLAQTQGSEANYQRLLAQAKAQLAGFQTFVDSQGGASLLSNQTVCNDWGCYYNQRDSQWGATALNHTQYTIASDGCLVTSMAMVMTHYGHKTLPTDINSNSANFASYYPAYLLYSISANGVSAQRVGTTIDATLSHHDPVIVGVHAYGGTHFIVLLEGSNGNYKMNDPYIEHGNGISFSDHYSLNSIFEIDKVIFI